MHNHGGKPTSDIIIININIPCFIEFRLKFDLFHNYEHDLCLCLYLHYSPTVFLLIL